MSESHFPTRNDVTFTFGEARDRYLQYNSLKSPHTVDAYRRAVELFFEFLGDRSGSHPLPIQLQSFVIPEQLPLVALSADDASLLLYFAEWLLAPSSGKTGDKRPYKPTTVELRLAGIQHWFQFMCDQDWLPPQFSLTEAKRIVRNELLLDSTHSIPTQPPDDIERIVYYYDTQEMPSSLRKPEADTDRVRRWELTRLRNTALLHVLAETGGRISEVLSLNLAHFQELKGNVLSATVIGKGGHSYSLHIQSALPAVYSYINARAVQTPAAQQHAIPLFVSHDPRYDGQPMSRVVAWRVVQRAARAFALHDITPHDFRHWRAAQLLRTGYTLDEVRDYLGHQSVETTRAYYASTARETE